MHYTSGMVRNIKKDKNNIRAEIEMNAALSTDACVQETFIMEIKMDYRSTSPKKAFMNGIDVLQPLQDNVTPEDLDAYLNAQEVYKEYLPSLQAFYDQGGEYLFRRKWKRQIQ